MMTANDTANSHFAFIFAFPGDVTSTRGMFSTLIGLFGDDCDTIPAGIPPGRIGVDTHRAIIANGFEPWSDKWLSTTCLDVEWWPWWPWIIRLSLYLSDLDLCLCGPTYSLWFLDILVKSGSLLDRSWRPFLLFVPNKNLLLVANLAISFAHSVRPVNRAHSVAHNFRPWSRSFGLAPVL